MSSLLLFSFAASGLKTNPPEPKAGAAPPESPPLPNLNPAPAEELFSAAPNEAPKPEAAPDGALVPKLKPPELDELEPEDVVLPKPKLNPELELPVPPELAAAGALNPKLNPELELPLPPELAAAGAPNPKLKEPPPLDPADAPKLKGAAPPALPKPVGFGAPSLDAPDVNMLIRAFFLASMSAWETPGFRPISHALHCKTLSSHLQLHVLQVHFVASAASTSAKLFDITGAVLPS